MKLNRTLVLCLSIVLAVSVALGGTLAFLTDTESKVNTFTVGDVDIEIVENFEQGSKLSPGVDVTKEVFIENVGNNDAYVWFTYALPVIANHDTDASQNVLHINTRGKYWDEYREVEKYWDADQTEAMPLDKTWNVDFHRGPDGADDETGLPIGYVDVPTELNEQGELDSYVTYAVYANLYHGVLPANQGEESITTPGMDKVYLDPRLDYVDGKYCFVDNGVTTELMGSGNDGKDNPIGIDNLKVIVNAYAIQYDGLENEDVDGAFNRYIGQWGEASLLQNVREAAIEQLMETAANP